MKTLNLSKSAHFLVCPVLLKHWLETSEYRQEQLLQDVIPGRPISGAILFLYNTGTEGVMEFVRCYRELERQIGRGGGGIACETNNPNLIRYALNHGGKTARIEGTEYSKVFIPPPARGQTAAV